MNWLDFVIIATWVFGFFAGWRIGLFGAIFSTGGLVVGVLLAARLSDNVSDLITDSISSDSLATVVAYGIILLATFLAAQVLKNIVKRMLKLVFLGWVDAVGAIGLGLVIGLVLSGALITVTARYSTDLPLGVQKLIDGDVTGRLSVPSIIERTGVQDQLNKALVESSLVPLFLDIRGALPGHSLGFVPDDFKIALDILQVEIDNANK